MFATPQPSYYMKALDQYIQNERETKGLEQFGLMVNNAKSEEDLAPQVLQMLVNSDEGRYEDTTTTAR